MLGIINGIKSIENKLNDASQYMEAKDENCDDCLEITNVLSAAFDKASEEVTQDMLSYNKYGNEDTFCYSE